MLPSNRQKINDALAYACVISIGFLEILGLLYFLDVPGAGYIVELIFSGDSSLCMGIWWLIKMGYACFHEVQSDIIILAVIVMAYLLYWQNQQIKGLQSQSRTRHPRDYNNAYWNDHQPDSGNSPVLSGEYIEPQEECDCDVCRGVYDDPYDGLSDELELDFTEGYDGYLARQDMYSDTAQRSPSGRYGSNDVSNPNWTRQEIDGTFIEKYADGSTVIYNSNGDIIDFDP